MRSTPPSPDDPVERVRTATRDRIDRFGFTKLIIGTGLCAVPGCECEPEPYPYVYTLGMCDHRSSEFIAFGLPMSVMESVIDPVCEAVMDGFQLPVGRDQLIQLPGDRVAALVTVPDCWVDHDPGRVGSWFDLYAPRWPTFVQICWSDEDGYLPWEPACNPAVAAVQPILADDPIHVPPHAE